MELPGEAQRKDAYLKWGQIVAKAWSDPAFKQRLLANPEEVLKEQGVDMPPGARVQMVEQTSNIVYLPIPDKPPAALSDEQLAQVAGGSTAGSAATLGTASSLGSCLGSLGSAGSAGTAS